jgi:hypothetical protein
VLLECAHALQEIDRFRRSEQPLEQLLCGRDFPLTPRAPAAQSTRRNSAEACFCSSHTNTHVCGSGATRLSRSPRVELLKEGKALMIASHKRGAGKWGQRNGGLEPLECRRLLAGNVTVTFDPVANQVNVVGDNKANQVQLTFDVLTATLTLDGLNGTTVNGVASVPVDSQVPLEVDTGKGDDVVYLRTVGPGSLTIQQPLSIETAHGADRILFDNLTYEDVSVSTGQGNDDVVMTNVFFMERLAIDTGNGGDSVTFTDTPAGVTATHVTIDGQNGPDAIAGIDNLHLRPFGTLVIDEVEVIT